MSDFLGRLFDGEALPLVEHLISARGLSRRDRAVAWLLNRLEAEQNERQPR